MNNTKLRPSNPAVLAALFALAGAFSPSSSNAASQTYTTVGDFSGGTLSNVVNVAPGQIQLSGTATPQPFMWIANAGEDTVSKINTSTNVEVARYRVGFGPAGSDPRPSWPTPQPGFPQTYNYHDAWTGPAPSRTAVDASGNVYVALRHFDNKSSVVVKILATGGIDRNGSGVIDTSTGPSDIKALLDDNNNGFQNTNEFRDERVAWSVQVGPANGVARSLSIGPDGNIWVGLYNDQTYYKLRASDGAQLVGPVGVGLSASIPHNEWWGTWYESISHRPYGSLVDSSGMLWSADLGRVFLKLNTLTNAASVYWHEGNTYGIALGRDGNVYLALRDYGSKLVAVFNPTTSSFSYLDVPGSSGTLGISTDPSGDIFISAATSTAGGGYALGATRLRADGSVVWSKAAQSGANGGDQRGAIVDSNGDVWTINRPNNNVSKFRGSNGDALGTVPVGREPYTYSDATGSAFLQSNPSGSWSVVKDTGCTGLASTISWNATVPSGSTLTVEARAANTVAGLGSQLFTTISNGGAVPAGRYIEVKASLTGTLTSTLTTPVLEDLTINTAADSIAPAINCPPNITQVAAPGQCGAPVSFSVIASDNCASGATVTYSVEPGSIFPVGATTVTATATDAAGNSSSCSFTVTVVDRENPTFLECPRNVIVNNDPGTCFANVSFVATAADNCGRPTVTYSIPPGSRFPVGTTTVTATATDGSNNTAACTFIVTVVDAEAPVIASLANISANTAPGSCDAKVSFATTAQDNCGAVTITYVPASGSVFAKGTTSVTATATDAAGNSASTTFSVTVVDNEKPVIASIRDITLNTLPGTCAAPASFGTTATDNCPGVTISYSAAPGSLFNKGTTTVTATATDASGNTADTTFTVTVLDLENPVIASLADLSVNTAPGRCDANVTFATTATDNCGPVTIAYSPASGSAFPKGTTTVTATATDSSGNTAITTFKVTVKDLENPVIASIPNVIVNTLPGTCAAPANFGTTVTDNCPGVTVSYSIAPGSVFQKGTTTVTATATDAAGNIASTSFTVTVVDQEKPVIKSIDNITLNTTAGRCDAPAIFATTATDNCPGVVVTYSAASGSAFPKGTTTVTATATDASGNTASTSFTVTVVDNEAPVFACPANIVRGNDLGLCTAIVTYAATATDNCAGVSAVTFSPASGSVFPKGVTTVTATATDAAGNRTTCTFTVTVNDTQAPVGTCVPTTNPSGNNVPAAGNNAKSGQNPDGFYQLLGTDNCDAASALTLFVKDSGSNYVSGPFKSGDKVKITQAPGVTPNTKPMAGAVVAHIQLKGDALLVVKDAAGNTSVVATCLVAPAPK